MGEEWFIDGYNVVHELAGPKSQKRPANPAKILPHDLFSKVANFTAGRARKALVVLDGVGDNNEFRAYRTESLDIVYSGKVSADTFIERSLYEARGRAILFVVTKDRAIAQVASGVGARVVEPKDFLARIHEDSKEKQGILFKHQVKAHGFSRPFEEKLKKFDPPRK